MSAVLTNGAPVAACTIVSKNYFAYAKTLAQSFRITNPTAVFYILIVDSADDREKYACEGCSVLFLADLGIPRWRAAAFKFGIVELNTNVKAALLLHLVRRHEFVFYLDPDILCYGSLTVLVDELRNSNVVLTPHSLSPLPAEDGRRPVDRDFLKCGVYNLGFIGVRATRETERFLGWWSDACLREGFNEPLMGLFVDQHWIDLAPCYFEGISIFRHPGCNAAYWNIHERLVVASDEPAPRVRFQEQEWPLLFFHFSGIEAGNVDQLAKHQDRFRLPARPDLRRLFEDYAARLKQNGHETYVKVPYAFSRFTSGAPIAPILRRYFAATSELQADEDPFGDTSVTFRFAKDNGLLLNAGHASPRDTSMNVDETGDSRIRWAGRVLRLALRVLGPSRFDLLCKFMKYYGVPNNHARIIFRK